MRPAQCMRVLLLTSSKGLPVLHPALNAISILLTCVDGLVCPQASASGFSSHLTRWACSAALPHLVGKRAVRLRRGGQGTAVFSLPKQVGKMEVVVRVAHTTGASPFEHGWSCNSRVADY